MHLKTLFNSKYLFQTLKKSKSVLALFMGLIPLLNIIIFLVMATTYKTGYVPSFTEISIINFIGVYIFPLILAVAFFGYTFKRKNSDFIGSLPINRKTIYFTNIVGGIGILLFVIILNIVLMAIANLFYPNLFMSGYMLFDYFIVWFITYTFMFIAASLAMTLTGNVITGIVVTALLVLLLPFMHDYTFNMASSDNYQINCNQEYCLDESDYNTVYINKDKEKNYIMPYQLLTKGLSSSNEPVIYNGKSLIMTLLVGLGYFIFGIYTFNRKQLEVTETSFKNINTHYLVKCLTLIPVGVLFYVAINEGINFIGSMFILALILAYYFIYDLITKKSISKIKLGLLYFLALSVFVFAYCSLSKSIYSKVNNTKFDNENIVSASLEFNPFGYYNYQESDLFVTDKEIIDLLLLELENNFKNDYRSKLETDDLKSINIILKDKKNTEYRVLLSVLTENYDKLKTLYFNSQALNDYFKNIDYNRYVAISLNDTVLSGEKRTKATTITKQILERITYDDYNKALNSKIESNYIKIYTYNNHRLNKYSVNINLDLELINLFATNTAQLLKEQLALSKKRVMQVERIISDNEIFEMHYEYIHYDNVNTAITDFIKNNLNEAFDGSKEYLEINVHYDNANYAFLTNKVAEFTTLYSEITEPLKKDVIYKDGIDEYEQ